MYTNNEENIDDFILREAAVAYGEKLFTEAEYLRQEWKHEQKHEYFRGKIFAMAGASPRHNIIFKNVFGDLAYHLKKKPCQPYGSDLRIHIPENSLFTYPDISIICGSILPSPFDKETAVGPSVIIEILSAATRKYDRGTKFNLYRDIPVFKEYILIDSDNLNIERFCRAEHNIWESVAYTEPSQKLFIQTIDYSLSLEDIYEGTLVNEQL